MNDLPCHFLRQRKLVGHICIGVSQRNRLDSPRKQGLIISNRILIEVDDILFSKQAHVSHQAVLVDPDLN